INCSPEAVRIGLPVRVKFRTVSDEIALPVFEPESVRGQEAAAGQGGAPASPSPVAPAKITETEYVLARPPRRVTAAERLERKAIISGVGQSAIGRRLFRSDVDLTVEASLAAIADAGLRPDDIDGIAAYPGGGVTAYPGFAGPGVVEMCDALELSV